MKLGLRKAFVKPQFYLLKYANKLLHKNNILPALSVEFVVPEEVDATSNLPLFPNMDGSFDHLFEVMS